MNKSMNYDINFVKIMTELAKINPQLIFKKSEEDENAITVKQVSADKAICYFLDAPKTVFDFESDSLAMIDFNRFVDYFNVFNKPNKDEKLADTPKLSIEYSDEEFTDSVVMHINSSKMKAAFRHRLADEDVIVKPSFNKINFPSHDTKFSLSEAELSELNSLISTISADRITFAFDGNDVKITLSNTKTSDTYENVYTIDTAVDSPFEITVPNTGIVKLPKGSYDIDVCKAGLMAFKQVREDQINLVLYVAKCK